MQAVAVISLLIIVVLATLSETVEAGTALSQSRTTTQIPAKKERLPYTPVKDSTRKERLPYTPPKSTTPPPYQLRPRTTTTKRIPFPVRTTEKSTPCKCNCNLAEGGPICGSNGNEQQTFVNRCQLDCYNCTHNKRYHIVKYGECN